MDFAAESLSVTEYETKEFPVPSLTIEPKFMALSVDEPMESVTVATGGDIKKLVTSLPEPALLLFAVLDSATELLELIIMPK